MASSQPKAPQEQPSESQMRAWTHTTAGHPSQVLTLTQTTKPALKSNADVLVRIKYASLSPGASIMMNLCPALLRSKPCIPEMDFAGIITEIGPEVSQSRTDLAPGVAVFGSVLVGRHLGAGAGALAEFIALPADCVVRKPEHMDFAQAAGLGVSGCTALVLMEKAKLGKGERVLVNGTSGGIGTMVVQMAKKAVGEEGTVVGVCSGANMELVKSLGTDEVIDYQKAPIHEYLVAKYSKNPFSSIIDAYGVQDVWTHCSSYLAPSGSFTSVGVAFASYTYSSMLYASYKMLVNTFRPPFLGGVNRPYTSVQGFVTIQGLEKLANLVEKKELTVPLDSEWKMEDALKAYERMLSRHARGKIVVEISKG